MRALAVVLPPPGADTMTIAVPMRTIAGEATEMRALAVSATGVVSWRSVLVDDVSDCAFGLVVEADAMKASCRREWCF